MVSCGKDEVIGKGSIGQLKNWANADVINAIVALGFNINEGDNPPNIEGSWRIKPRLLDKTNVPNDYSLGTEFWEYKLIFSQQDNSTLVLNFTGEEYDELGALRNTLTVPNYINESFITGNGDKFTVMFQVSGPGGSTQLAAFSGTKTATGFTGFQEALLMIDNNNDPGLIQNNEGRIFRDGDATVSKE
jgi:hypothetical protein